MVSRLQAFLVRRLLWALPVLALVSVVVFGLIRLVPGDPAIVMLGADADPARLAAVREEMGLNDPIYVQYVDYITDAIRGDLGRSYVDDQAVSAAIASRLPRTLFLTLAGFFVSLSIAIPAGLLSATNRGKALDGVGLTFGLLGVSIPNFWLGIVLLIAFGVNLGWLPVAGYASPLEDPVAGIRYLLLPGITLGTAMAAVVTRMLRSELLEELRREYLDAVRMKGVSDLRVLGHATKNAFIPVVTVIGMQFGYLLGGSVVVEQVFTIPGMGQLLIGAIRSRDYITLQGVVLVYTTFFVVVNVVVDAAYFYLNPKLRGDQ
ncbi:ABC transporter permease [Halolamina salifodinae]|uniref:Peptide/nickel transport system permease protein n=1 Tax=Halolamina salifodinae TaxID=1202767 RepID=A0A8T4GSU0_9EURY|nr:ABC transporter permease [Halolamina salifodinae]MBP1986161.1 peptide/nickel transport system permease protein [Halolamina salifodinae]